MNSFANFDVVSGWRLQRLTAAGPRGHLSALRPNRLDCGPGARLTERYDI